MYSWHIVVKDGDTIKDYKVTKKGKVENLEKPREKKRSITSILSKFLHWDSVDDSNSASKNEPAPVEPDQDESPLEDFPLEFEEYFNIDDFDMNTLGMSDMESNWNLVGF